MGRGEWKGEGAFDEVTREEAVVNGRGVGGGDCWGGGAAIKETLKKGGCCCCG